MKIQTFLLSVFMAVYLTIAGCAGFSQALKDNELVTRIAIKDTTILAIGESSKTDEGRQANAKKVANAADDVLKMLEKNTETTINKESIVDRFRQALGGKNMPLYYKIIIDDLIIILDSIYKVPVPTVEIPAIYAGDIKKVAGYIKDGTRLFIPKE